ncbi:MAG: DNA repair protein RecN [Nitrospirota bacterium]|nr:MAG: DNA repair protein RecN [Nitrospirota bacterium]
MLKELKIKNFAIVDSLDVEFHRGLNILSGETGAGKSVIIGALSLLLGGRANSDMIRAGAESAEVQALFEADNVPVLKEMGIDPGDGIIIRRSISANGKGRAYVNDSMTSVKKLEDIGKYLVDIHGQHDHQRLTSVDDQLLFIDTFGGVGGDLAEYKEKYRLLDKLRSELSETKRKAEERADRIDLLRFQINEIESSQLQKGEVSELEERRKILFNSAKLRELCESSYSLIYDNEGSVIDDINTVIANLRAISEYDGSAGEPIELLGSAEPLVSDAASILRDMRERYDADPESLAEVESRLDTIRRLQKKYGSTEEKILEHVETAKEELTGLEMIDDRIVELSHKIEGLTADLTVLSQKISGKREDASKKIEKLVTERLKDLAFKKVKFLVDVQRKADDKGELILGPDGSDDVEFLFTANISEPPKPLKRVASGGELSRVMLAIKSVFAEIDDIPVMIFDEIDAGIGGKTAMSVGDALAGLSVRHQVLCITHLAQIASKATVHYSIEKTQQEKRVKIDVKLLTGNERVKEVARMLSGKVTQTSIKHSEELLEK